MSYRGLLGVCFDELEWKAYADSDVANAGIPLCDTMVPGRDIVNVRGSKCGGSFQAIVEHETGDAEGDGSITGRTENYIGYYAWAKVTGYTVTAAGRQSFLTSHRDGTAAPNGAVRAVWVFSGSGVYTVKLLLELKKAGAWVTFSAEGADIDLTALPGPDCWCLQVDLATTYGRARLMRYTPGGSWGEYIGWNTGTATDSILAAGVISNPSLGFKQLGAKGTTNVSLTVSSYWVFESDTAPGSAGDLPDHEDASGYDYEAWATYPSGDNSIGNWVSTGGPCTGLWRVLCDPEEPDATTNGYISESSASEEIAWFDIADISAGSDPKMVELCGVGLSVILQTSDVSSIGLKLGADISWKTGTTGIGTTGGTNRYAFWSLQPDGATAWAVANLATLKVGVKANAATAGKCYGLVVTLLGAGGRRPTSDLTACPAAYEELAGTIAAVASLSGSVYRKRNLLGTSPGQAALSGNLIRNRILSGQVAGLSVLSGDLFRTRPIAGQISAESALVGDLFRTRPLAGTIAPVSSLVGILTKLVDISGEVVCLASLSGALYRIRNLPGLISALSGLTGSVYVTWSLQGSISGQSYLIASLGMTYAEPIPPIGIAIGPETLTAASRIAEGLAATGLIATPLLPGRGEEVRTPLGTGRDIRLPPGLALHYDTPHPGSAGVPEALVGLSVIPTTPVGKGDLTLGSPYTLINLDENPSFEVDTSCVYVTNGVEEWSNTKAKYGSYSCKITQTAIFFRANKMTQAGLRQPVVPGLTYIHSVQAIMQTGTGTILVSIGWYDSLGDFISSQGVVVAVNATTWSLGQYSEQAPSNAATAQPYVQGYLGFSVGEIVYLDGEEFRQEVEYSTPYLDGDQEHCEWLGAPHLSASGRIPFMVPVEGTGKSVRTMEGQASTDRPPQSGKAV